MGITIEIIPKTKTAIGIQYQRRLFKLNMGCPFTNRETPNELSHSKKQILYIPVLALTETRRRGGVSLHFLIQRLLADFL